MKSMKLTRIHLFLSSFFGLIILMNIAQVSSYTFKGFLIRDLESTDSALFQDEVLAWTLSTPTSSGKTYEKLDSYIIIGGPSILGTPSSTLNEYFERIYTQLPYHTFIRLSMSLYYFGLNWPENSPALKITLDATEVAGPRLESLDFQIHPTPENSLENIYVKAGGGHWGSSLTLRIMSLIPIPSTTRSFGFRNLSLLFINATNAVPTCHFSTTQSLIHDTCECGLGYYEDPSGCDTCAPECQMCYGSLRSECLVCSSNAGWDGTQCTSCHSTCQSCTGPNSNDCSECRPGFYKYDNGTCSTSCELPFEKNEAEKTCKKICGENYLWTESECREECPLPLVTSFDTANGVSWCVNRCRGSDKYLYPTGDCGDCPFPLVKKSYLYLCEDPCPNQWIYQDGNCTNECNYPFTQNFVNPFQYCMSPCQPLTLYYYPNGECKSHCPLPLLANHQIGIVYCENPCEEYPSHFLYPDSSCFNECNPPLQIEPEEIATFCKSPCPNSQYLYPNGECGDCPPPYLRSETRQIRECKNPCTNSDNFVYPDGSCHDSCQIPLTPRIETWIKLCKNPCSSSQSLSSFNGCLNTCPEPFKERFEFEVRFCDNPCSSQSKPFLYPDSLCESECSFPLRQKYIGAARLCENPCSQPNLFLYTDGSCLDDCPQPFEKQENNIATFCFNPCSFPTQFTFTDGTCLNECALPLIAIYENTIKRCSNPCSLASQFLYTNGACSQKCLPPLSERFEDGVRFCENPCLNRFLYEDQTCADTCSPPLQKRIEPEAKFCLNPCQRNQFLYFNGSCQTECPTPFLKTSNHGLNYCSHPCPASNNYVLQDGSCSDSCQVPMISMLKNEIYYCLKPCDSQEDFLYPNGSCFSDCTPPLIVQKSSGIQFCTSPCEDNSMFIAEDSSCQKECEYPQIPSLESIGKFCRNPPTFVQNTNPIVMMAKFNKYIPYVNIPLPERLDKVANSQGINKISLPGRVKMSEAMLQAFPKHPLPHCFEKRGLHSSFLVNFWGELTFLVIAIFCGFALLLLERLATVKGWEEARIALTNVKVLARNNWILILFAMYLDEIILYASLEFRTLQITSFPTFLSFIFSLGMVTSVIAYLAGIYFLVRKGRLIRQKSLEKYEDFIWKWQGYQAVFGGLKEEKPTTHFFYFLYVSRAAIVTTIGAYFFDAPVMNATLQMLFSIGIIVFTSKTAPIKKKTTFIQLLINESIFLLTNICMLALTAEGIKGNTNSSSQATLGDIIIIGNSIANSLVFFFLLLKLGIEIREIRKVQQSSSKFTISTCFQVLSVFLQQAGMGFEEIKIPSMRLNHLKPNQTRVSQIVPVEENGDITDLSRAKLSHSNSKLFETSNSQNPFPKTENVSESNFFQKTDLELDKLNDLMDELTKKSSPFVPKKPKKRPQPLFSKQTSQINQSDFLKDVIVEPPEVVEDAGRRDSYWIPYQQDHELNFITDNIGTNGEHALHSDRPLVENLARSKLRKVLRGSMNQ